MLAGVIMPQALLPYCREWLSGALLGFLIFAFCCTAPPLAVARVTCGTIPPGATDPVEAKLVLKGGASKTTYDFGTSGKTVTLDLQYAVTGCAMRSRKGTRVSVQARGESDAFSGRATVDPQDTLLTVNVPVSGRKMSAGTHTATVIISGDAVRETSSELTVTRKQPPWPGPILALVGAALLGYGTAVGSAYLKARREAGHKPLEWQTPGYFLVALAGSALGALAAANAAYIQVPGWEGDLDAYFALCTAGAAASAGGRMAGVLGVGVKPPKDNKKFTGG